MIYTPEQLKDLILPILQSMAEDYEGVAAAIVEIIIQDREANNAEV